MKYKTFKDLNFLDKSTGLFNFSFYQAHMEFANGYEVSVVYDTLFFSIPQNTYELAVLKEGELCYDTYITENTIRGLTQDEVSDYMIKVQKLESIYNEDDSQFEEDFEE